MAVVSNTSPLVLYAKLGRLDLLRELFSEVMIPAAVHEEISVRGGGRPGAAEIIDVPWIRSRSVLHSERVQQLLIELGRGEAEAITLAKELGEQTPILIDDRKGRRIARNEGLRLFGSAGVLVLAKEQGLILRVQPVLDELRRAGLYLSEVAYDEALSLAGELMTRETQQ